MIRSLLIPTVPAVLCLSAAAYGWIRNESGTGPAFSGMALLGGSLALMAMAIGVEALRVVWGRRR